MSQNDLAAGSPRKRKAVVGEGLHRVNCGSRSRECGDFNMSKYSDELHSRVDEILYYIWDPIGVAAEPSARDEYSRYVPELISIL
jgi:hypothetical protein